MPIEQRKSDCLGVIHTYYEREIYYLPQGIPYGTSGYYSVGYEPNAEVLPQRQKADNIFNK
jgi:hypothetical protein